MKKIILIVVIIMALISCDKKATHHNEPKLGRYFFKFDEVVHYKIEIDEDTIYNSADADTKRRRSKLRHKLTENEIKDSLITGVFLDEMPQNVVDASFEQNLKKIGFVSKKNTK